MNKFLTFGEGPDTFKAAASRLSKEVKSLNLFSVIENNNFSTLDKDFQNKHKDLMFDNNRGFGFWIWKFHIINRMFENSEDGDKVLYSDAGCRYLADIKTKLSDALALDYDVIDHTHGGDNDTFKTGGPGYWLYGASTNNETWTKMDTLKYLEATEEVRKQRMHAATVLMFTVNDKTRNLVKKIDTIMQSDYHLIDDTPSNEKNVKGFMSHRHDQSIYSLCLCSDKDLKVNTNCTNWVSRFRYKKG